MNSSLRGKRAVTWIAMLASWLAAGCSDDGVARKVQALKGSCSINSDCEQDLICAFGRCHEECNASNDCPRGARCVLADEGDLRVCQFDDEASCELNRDCKGDQICGSDGLCRDECTQRSQCAERQVCASEGVCAEQDEVKEDGSLVTSSGPDSGPPPDASVVATPQPSQVDGGATSDAMPTGMPSVEPSSSFAAEAGAPSATMPTATATATAAAPDAAVSAGSVVFTRGSTDVTDAVKVDSITITEDQTWSGRVYVTTTVSISADLELAPGTDVILAANVQLYIGNGSLHARGTATEPVRFYGEKGPGSWGGIRVTANTDPTSSLQNVLIADAGTDGFGLYLDAAIQLDNVQVLDADGTGVTASTFGEGSKELSIVGAKGTAVELRAESAINNFPLGGKIEGNGEDAARIPRLNSGAYVKDVHFKDIGVPYIQQSDMKIIDAAFVMDPGVDYRIATDTILNLSQTGHDVDVLIEGTAEKPVIFQGEEAVPGYWGGLTVVDTVRLNSSMKHVIIRHAGVGGASPFTVNNAITLQDITLEDNLVEEGVGVFTIGSKGLATDSSNIVIRNNDGAPLSLPADVLLEADNIFSFTDNTDPRILISSAQSIGDGTIPNWGLPYLMPDVAEIRAGARWMVEPGTEMQFPFLGRLNVTGALVAHGTQAEPIRFLGEESGPGTWYGVFVYLGAAGTDLDWVTIRDGGYGGACLSLQRAVDVNSSSFENCAGYGILRDSSDTNDYSSTNVFTDVELGDIGDL